MRTSEGGVWPSVRVAREGVGYKLITLFFCNKCHVLAFATRVNAGSEEEGGHSLGRPRLGGVGLWGLAGGFGEQPARTKYTIHNKQITRRADPNERRVGDRRGIFQYTGRRYILVES